MSNLSKELSGVILPHDHFGTHLDNENDTIDEELELQNFEHAGEVNDHPVVAEFVGRELLDITITKEEEWKANYVRESEYLLQTVKCTDTACCSPFQSSYLKKMNKLSHPLPVVFSLTVIGWAKDDKEATYLLLFQNAHWKVTFNQNMSARNFLEAFLTIIFALRWRIMERICKHWPSLQEHQIQAELQS